jgi:hypothetical protein
MFFKIFTLYYNISLWISPFFAILQGNTCVIKLSDESVLLFTLAFVQYNSYTHYSPRRVFGKTQLDYLIIFRLRYGPVYQERLCCTHKQKYLFSFLNSFIRTYYIDFYELVCYNYGFYQVIIERDVGDGTW